MKSRPAVAHSLETSFVVEEVELPDLQPTDVLVRIVAVGICHTDAAGRDGQLPAPFPAMQLNGTAVKPILDVSVA